jgi:pyruvate formate-lyase/glycerol dehydratase family glycyl radical enzyme
MFGKIETARIKQLREIVLESKPSVCTDRAKIITQSYKQNEDQPIVMKRALAVKDVLEKMSIYIMDGELIVGNHSSAVRAAPIFPEYSMDWVIDELDEFEKRPGDIYTITEEKKQELKDIFPYWENKTLIKYGLSLFPKESIDAYENGVIRAEGNLTSGDGHVAANFDKVLKIGIKGLKVQTQKKLSSLDPTRYDQLKQMTFLRSIIITLDAIIDFAKRFSDLAHDMSQNERDEKRKRELLKISQICAKVPQNPAQTFYEGVQSAWFVQLALQIESNGHSVSFGRLDQFLYPLYQKDIANGTMDEKGSRELLENLWIKLYTITKIRSWSHTRFSAGGPLYQNVTVGGQTVDGKDAVNDLSYRVLESVSATRLTQPNLTVRYHKNLSDDFMKRCIDVIKLGFGMPAFNSDEIIIPTMVDLGVKKQDAYNYSAVGCVEVAVPGKWGYRCTGMSFLNFMKVLKIALNRGIDPDTGVKYLDSDKQLGNFDSFEDVFESWSKTVRYFARQTVIIDTAVDTALEELVPDILCSALTDDCIERGKHLKEGGAVYDYISGLQVGIANLGNSLLAIKNMVFDKKVITQNGLKVALDNDFAGVDGEIIRQKLLKIPAKFGQDSDDVDLLTHRAYMVFIDELSKYNNTRYGRGPIGGKYYAGTSSISANVPSGAKVGATPDGRKAYTPLAEGCSPSGGTDIFGPTAVLKSVGKLPTERIMGGVLLNQKISPTALETNESKMKLNYLIRTFFNDLKGFHIQYNVVDRATLEDAVVHPEKHRDLIVRVAGYSAFFTVLSPDTQRDIIGRTEHTL